MSHKNDMESYKKWLSDTTNIPLENITIEDLYVDDDGVFHYRIYFKVAKEDKE